MSPKGRKRSRQKEVPETFNFKLAASVFIAVMLLAMGGFLYWQYSRADDSGGGIEVLEDTSKESGGTKGGHRPLVELFVTTSCPVCPRAEHPLSELYESDKDFTYVVMVADVNQDAYARASTFSISGVPTSVYDGGVDKDTGALDSDSYRSVINTMAKRTVPDVDISVEYTYNGGGYSITVGIASSAAEDINGHIRVYVMEKNSRYTAVDGSTIKYAFIDYAADSQLTVPSHDTVNKSYTWNGDVSSGNIVIAAAYFDGGGKLVDSAVA